MYIVPNWNQETGSWNWWASLWSPAFGVLVEDEFNVPIALSARGVLVAQESCFYSSVNCVCSLLNCASPVHQLLPASEKLWSLWSGVILTDWFTMPNLKNKLPLVHLIALIESKYIVKKKKMAWCACCLLIKCYLWRPTVSVAYGFIVCELVSHSTSVTDWNRQRIMYSTGFSLWPDPL